METAPIRTVSVQAWHAHVHPHLVAGLVIQGDEAGGGLHGDLVLVRQALFAHEAGETAGAVAAHGHLRTIGVEDAVTETGARIAARLHQQELVAADAEMAIAEETDALGVEVDVLTHGVDDDEIVAQAMHLGESQGGHGR